MSTTAPSLPLFGDAYLADTRHLSLEEHGAYLQLLMIAWRSEGCSLPDDDARLARMLGIPAAKWRKLKPTVMDFWTLGNGVWTQGRLSKEREYVDRKRAQNKAAAETRWSAQPIEKTQGDECERMSERNAPPPPPPEEGLKTEDKPLSSSAQRLPVDEAVGCWNEAAAVAGWASVTRISEPRRKLIRDRLRAEGIEGWRAAMIRARASPYLGRDPPSFFTFDWVIKPANFLKLIEGNYDRQSQSHHANGNPSGPGRTGEAMRAVLDRVGGGEGAGRMESAPLLARH